MQQRLVSVLALVALALSAAGGSAAASAGSRGHRVRGHRHRCRTHACHHARVHPARPRTLTGTPGTTATAPISAPRPTPAPGAGPAPAPARLQVTAREFSLTLSHPQIASGAAIVEFVNRGEDPHDLRIRPAAGGQDLLAFGVGLPGSHVDQSTALPPGTYVLYCALPGHEAAGMHVTLTVG